MKKLLALIIILAIGVFSGCGRVQEKVSDPKETESPDKAFVDTGDKPAYEEPSNKGDDQNPAPSEEDGEILPTRVDKSYFRFIGMTPSEVSSELGPMEGSTWEDGPYYSYGGLWFAFSEYDFSEDGGYVPSGTCMRVNVPLRLMLPEAKVCDADTLEACLGKVLSEGYSEMIGSKVYAVSADGVDLHIYASSRDNIDGDSIVSITGE